MQNKERIPPLERCHAYLEGKGKDSSNLLEKKFIDPEKGYGVFAKEPIQPGAFLLEYKGQIISEVEAKKRLKRKGASYIFYIEDQKETICIDGERPKSLCSFINDGFKNNNSVMKLVPHGKTTHLCLFAIDNSEGILPGDELLYNYGKSEENMFWREGNRNPFPYKAPKNDLYQSVPEQQSASIHEPTISKSAEENFHIRDQISDILTQMAELKKKSLQAENAVEKLEMKMINKMDETNNHVKETKVEILKDVKDMLLDQGKKNDDKFFAMLNEMGERFENINKSTSNSMMLNKSDEKKQESVSNSKDKPAKMAQINSSGTMEFSQEPLFDIYQQSEQSQGLAVFTASHRCTLSKVTAENGESDIEYERSPNEITSFGKESVVEIRQQSEHNQELLILTDSQKCKPNKETPENEYEISSNKIISCGQKSVVEVNEQSEHSEELSLLTGSHEFTSNKETFTNIVEDLEHERSNEIMPFGKESVVEKSQQSENQECSALIDSHECKPNKATPGNGDSDIEYEISSNKIISCDQKSIVEVNEQSEHSEELSLLTGSHEFTSNKETSTNIVEDLEHERSNEIMPFGKESVDEKSQQSENQECSVLIDSHECKPNKATPGNGDSDIVYENSSSETESIFHEYVANEYQQLPQIQESTVFATSPVKETSRKRKSEYESSSSKNKIFCQGLAAHKYQQLEYTHELEVFTGSHECSPNKVTSEDGESDMGNENLIDNVVPSLEPVIYKHQHSEQIHESEIFIVSSKRAPTEVTTEKAKLGPYSQKVQKGKPWRPCIFCQKKFAKVSRHIKQMHGNEEVVQNLLKLPKKTQDKEIRKLIKKGIYKYNIDLLKVDKNSKLMMIRSQNSKNGVVICQKCFGTFGKRSFSTHKKSCNKAESLLIRNTNSKSNVYSFTDTDDDIIFRQEILSKFRRRADMVTSLIHKSNLVLSVGKKMFSQLKAKNDKKGSIRKRVMGSMRLLSRLLVTFFKVGKKAQRILKEEDIFDKKYFQFFEKAVIMLSSSQDKIHHSIRLLLQNAIKICLKTMNYIYTINDEIDKLEKLKQFKSVFEFNSPDLFGPSEYHVKNQRSKKLRRPAQLPLEEDMKKLNKYIMKEISRIKEIEKWVKDTFLDARRIVVCYLTILNARRSSEPTLLTLTDINTAKNNEWVDYSRIPKDLDEADKILIENNCIAYISGKGDNLLSVFIPEEVIPLIDKLIDPRIRKIANVNPENIYAFPSTGGSENNASGWHLVHEVCVSAKLKKNINSVQNRHRMSTIFSGLNLPESSMKLFYEHIGHSKEIDLNVYAAPRAVSTLLYVGKELHKAFCDEPETDPPVFPLSENDEVIIPNDAPNSPDANDAPNLVDANDADVDHSRFDEQDREEKSTYFKWSDEDKETVLKHFRIFLDQKGSFPDKEKIEGFLFKNATILQPLDHSQKIKKIRNLVMNEKRWRHKSSMLFS